MSAYLLIIAIESVVLLAVWRWDERTRRAELDRRRRLRRTQAETFQIDSSSVRSATSPSGPTMALTGRG